MYNERDDLDGFGAFFVVVVIFLLWWLIETIMR